MDRRRFLVALGALAGCSQSDGPQTATEGGDSEATQTAQQGGSDGRAQSPTVRSTPTAAPLTAETTLSLGEWFDGDRWGVAVDDVEVGDSFVDTFAQSTPDGTVSVPDGERLLVAWFRLRNLRQRPASPLTRQFGFVSEGDLLAAVDGYEHPEYSDGLDLDWLALADETPRYSTLSTEQIDSGETVERWVGTLAPAEFADDAGVAFGAEVADDRPVPAVWR
jgi:hypothetical protein